MFVPLLPNTGWRRNSGLLTAQHVSPQQSCLQVPLGGPHTKAKAGSCSEPGPSSGQLRSDPGFPKRGCFRGPSACAVPKGTPGSHTLQTLDYTSYIWRNLAPRVYNRSMGPHCSWDKDNTPQDLASPAHLQPQKEATPLPPRH